MAAAKKKTCFVVGPIGAPDSETRVHADWLFEEIILPVFADIPEYEVVRADKIAQPGMIDAQIIRHLINDELVIADLSNLNPNAFYEIGIRHMAQKPVIHVQIAEESIPFDVSLYSTTRFARTRPGDLRDARSKLAIAVKAAIAEGYEIDNPVTRALGQIKIAQAPSSSENKILLESMRSIESRVAAMEGVFKQASLPPLPVTRTYDPSTIGRVGLFGGRTIRLKILYNSLMTSADDVLREVMKIASDVAPHVAWAATADGGYVTLSQNTGILSLGTTFTQWDKLKTALEAISGVVLVSKDYSTI